ncbi:right-handed parallel beta-helix repeat-containing protein [Geminicoccaceae bacterium 1502E]|nr:right-handed parallel beta-helix repeat-containing protein [Geminicoccaceae bacterium 1502E]
MIRTDVALLALLASQGAGCALPAGEPAAIMVGPGEDLAAIVAGAPEASRFLLEPGVYRQQSIRPKNGQQFIGQKGVVLSGAMELGTWARQPPFWVAEGLPRPLPFHGECATGREICSRREDLFVGGRLYRRVASRSELGPGAWYREKDRAWLADDPAGQPVELGVTPRAFDGEAKGVVLQDLIVEKYASDAQEGAIFADRARDWLLVDVTARWNHGAGLSFGTGTRVQGGSFSHNGQLGIAGAGENAILDGVQIAFNNYAGYDSRWEAGGTKFWETRGLIVRNACVHHNEGPGLWTDNDNVDVLLEANLVFSNADEGIKHEISYDAVIRDNIVAGNGSGGLDAWLWGSQILIQNSSNAEVYGNRVEVAADFGNGIGVIHQDRGGGALGPWGAAGNVIRDNTIIHLGSHGQNGVVSDTGDPGFWAGNDNVFDGNSYIVPDGRRAYWTWHDRDGRWADLGRLGLEASGRLVVERATPAPVSCEAPGRGGEPLR